MNTFKTYEGLSLSEIVRERNGLPLYSRTVDEALQDYLTGVDFRNSFSASLERRSAPRYESQKAVAFYDYLSDTFQELGSLTGKYVECQYYAFTQGE